MTCVDHLQCASNYDRPKVLASIKTFWYLGIHLRIISTSSLIVSNEKLVEHSYIPTQLALATLLCIILIGMHTYLHYIHHGNENQVLTFSRYLNNDINKGR